MDGNSEKIIRQAEKFIKRGRVNEAIEKYLEYLAIFPRAIKIHFILAEIFVNTNIKEKAIEHYLEAVKYYTKDCFYSRALGICRRMVALDENRDDIYVIMADLYQRMDMIGDAIAQYKIALERYEKSGRIKEAIEICKKILDLDPHNHNMDILTKLTELHSKNPLPDGVNKFSPPLVAKLEPPSGEEGLKMVDNNATPTEKDVSLFPKLNCEEDKDNRVSPKENLKPLSSLEQVAKELEEAKAFLLYCLPQKALEHFEQAKIAQKRVKAGPLEELELLIKLGDFAGNLASVLGKENKGLRKENGELQQENTKLRQDLEKRKRKSK